MNPEGQAAFEAAVGIPRGKLIIGLAIGKAGTGPKPAPKNVTCKGQIIQ
jgi:hypothetical protein